MINTILVDDHNLIRHGISQMLSQDKEIKIVAEAEDGETAVKLTKQHKPDVVLLDINLPDTSGLAVIKKLKEIQPNVKIIIITGYMDSLLSSDIINTGAIGYLSKETEPEDISKAIKLAYQGQFYFSPDIANRLIDQKTSHKKDSPFAVLSEREREIVDYTLQGFAPNDIAEKLNLSPKTVNTFRYRAFDKLGIKNDVELALLAIRHKMIETEQENS